MATEHNQMGEQVIAILKDAKTGEVKQVEKTQRARGLWRAVEGLKRLRTAAKVKKQQSYR